MKTGADLLVVDLETNGRDVPEIRITQIGALRLEKDTLRELASFSMYVGMGAGDPALSDKSKLITGITEETLKGHPTFRDAGARFSQWAYSHGPDFIPCAWGSHFDIPTLRWEYARCGMKFGLTGKSFCIKSAMYDFCWQRDVGIYRCSVNTALKVLGFEFDGKPHDALDDVRNEARILKVISGIEEPGPNCMIKRGHFLKTSGGVSLDLGDEDRKSPYDDV